MTGNTLISLPNLKFKVKTIFFELENLEQSETLDYEIFYSDDTTIGRSLCFRTYNDFVPKTKYVATFLSGDCKGIDIKIYNGNVNISKLALNDDIPFEFNLVRVITLIIIASFIYSLFTSKFWNEEYSVKSLSQNLSLLFIIDIAVIIVYFFNTYASASKEPVKDLYNVNLVESLSKGQVSLIDEPKEKLLNLDNPYDMVERNINLERDTDYIWDSALYNGKYYVYFGILPALIMFLPYHIITGKFLTTAVGVLIFSELSIVVIAILTKEIFKKYFPKVPFKFMFFSIITMMFGTMLIWINVAPRFYELVTVAGFFFAVLGFLLILTCEKNKDDTKEVKVSYIKIFFGTLSLALAVACRPTELFVSILIIPFLWRIFKRNLKEKKDIVKIILLTLIPYIIVGISLMIYNYIRFGSILEFGANYQLTVNDTKALGLRFSVIPIGLICSLFNLPCFQAVFPFIHTNYNIIERACYYYVEDIPGGIFFIAPICFFSFYLIKFFKKTDKKELKSLVISLISVRIISCNIC